MVVLCASKDGRLWHILKESAQTYCGLTPVGTLTDPIELPEDKHLICLRCLEAEKGE